MLFKNYPNICDAHWEEDVKAVRPQWTTFAIDVAQFETILTEVLNFLVEKKAKNWIVDTYETKGVISAPVTEWLQTIWFPLALQKGVKNFITIVPKSALTQLANNKWQATIGDGFTLVNVSSLEDAKNWIKENNQ